MYCTDHIMLLHHEKYHTPGKIACSLFDTMLIYMYAYRTAQACLTLQDEESIDQLRYWLNSN